MTLNDCELVKPETKKYAEGKGVRIIQLPEGKASRAKKIVKIFEVYD